MANKKYIVKFGGDGYYDIDGRLNPSIIITDARVGDLITFEVSAVGHPFWIKSSLGAGSSTAYSTHVTSNGLDFGVVTLKKTSSTPDILYYQCGNHSAMWGQIYVRSIGHGPVTTTYTPYSTTSAPTTTPPPEETTPPPPPIPPTDPDYTTTTTPEPYIGRWMNSYDLSSGDGGDGGDGGVVAYSSITTGMKFPANSIYTNAANDYRWGDAGINAGANEYMTKISTAMGITRASLGYHDMGSRGFAHFADSGVMNNQTAAQIRAEYPSFHLSKFKSYYGIQHYHARRGPNYDSGWGYGLGSRQKTTVVYKMYDIERDPAGGYLDTGNGPPNVARSPFHPRYDVASEYHDYPRATYLAETDFTQNLVKYNGVAANPLSKAGSYGSTLGLIFSRFYHYDVGLKEGPVGFINHNGVNGDGKTSFTYNVTSSEPIARKASGGVKNSLEWVTTWSPYNGAFRLDFTNGNAFNTQLYTSSIWK